MPTMADLRDAFERLEQRAPEHLSSPIAPRRPDHRKRRFAAIGLAAACTAAVAVAAPFVLRGSAHHSAATPTPSTHTATTPPLFRVGLPAPKHGHSPVLRLGFTVAPVAGYQVSGSSIDGRMQSVDLHTSDGAFTGQLQVYYAGGVTPDAVHTGTPVKVNGRSGYFQSFTLHKGFTDYTLTWEYAPRAWALLDLAPNLQAAGTGSAGAAGRSMTAREIRAGEVHLAEATHPASVSVDVPYSVSGLDGASVSQLAAASEHDRYTALDTGSRSWDLVWGRPSPKPYFQGWESHHTTTTTIDGRLWTAYHSRSGNQVTRLVYAADGYELTIGVTDADVSAHPSRPLGDFVALLSHVRLAPSFADKDTWFDAATALP